MPHLMSPREFKLLYQRNRRRGDDQLYAEMFKELVKLKTTACECSPFDMCQRCKQIDKQEEKLRYLAGKYQHPHSDYTY